jgi:hypothetical protein
MSLTNSEHSIDILASQSVTFAATSVSTLRVTSDSPVWNTVRRMIIPLENIWVPRFEKKNDLFHPNFRVCSCVKVFRIPNWINLRSYSTGAVDSAHRWEGVGQVATSAWRHGGHVLSSSSSHRLLPRQNPPAPLPSPPPARTGPGVASGGGRRRRNRPCQTLCMHVLTPCWTSVLNASDALLGAAPTTLT